MNFIQNNSCKVQDTDLKNEITVLKEFDKWNRNCNDWSYSTSNRTLHTHVESKKKTECKRKRLDGKNADEVQLLTWKTDTVTRISFTRYRFHASFCFFLFVQYVLRSAVRKIINLKLLHYWYEKWRKQNVIIEVLFQ